MIVEIIIAAVLSVVSLIWMYVGIFKLGLIIPGVKASAGLIPTIFACLTLVFSIVMLVNAIRALRAQDEKEKLSKEAVVEKMKTFLPAVFVLVGIFVFKYFGVLITTFLLTFVWLIVLSKKKWTFALIVAVCVTLFIYLVFELWLKIPFPGEIIRL
ncbi:MAG: tripartite tricarboxylate transporter TctB family protein [Spirochaetales bacterium]|nr:tripartite tricarboxylate transporter TctB family protein [Spirochaetales bacterium]